jgi:hypothetical protein
MAQRMVTCDIPIERETLQVCLYVPRVLSYSGRKITASLGNVTEIGE